MDPMDVLVICGLIVAFVYGLGLFLVLLAKVRRNRGGIRADSSAPEALLVTLAVDAGAGEIINERSFCFRIGCHPYRSLRIALGRPGG